MENYTHGKIAEGLILDAKRTISYGFHREDVTATGKHEQMAHLILKMTEDNSNTIT